MSSTVNRTFHNSSSIKLKPYKHRVISISKITNNTLKGLKQHCKYIYHHNHSSKQFKCDAILENKKTKPIKNESEISFTGVHHVGFLCENLESSLEFYQNILGLEVNSDRPDKKLPYRGAWFWIGNEMIHLMELPNPDPMEGRPVHGGRDRHVCFSVEKLDPLIHRLNKYDISYTESKSGRRAVFFRDPDMNCLECFEIET